MNITSVLGARPQIIKSTPFVHLANEDKKIQLDIIHTGQHDDYEMTKIFFEQLHLPDPTANLNVGSGPHAQQTATIMLRLENIAKTKTDLVIVPDDNTRKSPLVNMKNL